ncbi:MAG TPA: Crp/Fnr family transcriptional regulator [Actinomycetota bacterium]|nr:Crp/Fnr family transcriptional regulator [Actinomycetota bacterium]
MTGSGGDPGTFLDAIASDDRSALISAARKRRYPKGDSLFNEGNRSDRVMILLEGRAKVARATEEGKEVLLALRGPGDLLGEMSAFDGEPHSASATALEDCETLVLTTEEFTTFLETHPSAALTLLTMLTERLRDADEKRVDFLAYDAESRVARRLVELAERFGESTDRGIRIKILSQEEIGGWLGASRESVSKALQTMRSRGWIETYRREITVVDLDALRRRAT